MDVLEFRLCILTTIGVVGMGVLPGVAIAIFFALLIILYRIYRPDDAVLGVVPGLDGYNDLSISSEASTIPGIILWRFDGPLVFFNAEYFKTRIKQIIEQSTPEPRWLIISLESISQLDTTGVTALREVQEDLSAKGITMLLARPKRFMTKYAGPAQSAGHVFESLRKAVDYCQAASS